MINNYKVPNSIIIEDDLSREWKIHLTMQITFISSVDNTEICTVDSKSDNVEIMIGYETNDIIEGLFESFKEKYYKELKTKMKGSPFIFKSVDLLCYSLHKINLNKGGSYIDSSEWLKNKRATINSKNKVNGGLKNSIITVLNHKKN